MPFWDRKEAEPEEVMDTPDGPVMTGTIPVAERPSVNGDSSGDDSGFVFGDPEDADYSRPVETTSSGREVYTDDEGVRRYVDTNRKVRSDAGAGSRKPSTTRRRKARGNVHEKAGAGATILYGGAGAILTGTGIAPAAGYSMQGLADEAGPEIAEWASKRSPRLYRFLEQLSDAGGIGKYVAGPMSAEAYLRMERARPALGPVVVSIHGPEIEAPMNQLVEQYDSWRASMNTVDPNMNGQAE